jgi:CheY-like chemotaxis protein
MDKETIVLLIAEDDEDDYLLVKEALEDVRLRNTVHWVKDGEELMDYLLRQGEYADPEKSPRPGIILLDLNMPRKDGREALREIKSNPDLKNIPVIVLTVSRAEEDVIRSYDLGVNSYIRKPVRFDEFIEAIKIFEKYWLEIVSLPTGDRHG